MHTLHYVIKQEEFQIITRENTIKKDGKISILMAFGEYDISKNKYEEITSPYSRDCEKNWSYKYGTLCI